MTLDHEYTLAVFDGSRLPTGPCLGAHIDPQAQLLMPF